MAKGKPSHKQVLSDIDLWQTRFRIDCNTEPNYKLVPNPDKGFKADLLQKQWFNLTWLFWSL